MTSPATTASEIRQPPVSFHAESSKRPRLDASAFRGRVPVVLSFVGPHGATADSLIRNLDRALIRFGERRVQLLVVVDGEPSTVAERLNVTVPLITDDGLSTELGAAPDEHGSISSVILGNDGRALDIVRQLPVEDQAAAILLAIERLTDELPDRFTVLPGTDEHGDQVGDPLR